MSSTRPVFYILERVVRPPPPEPVIVLKDLVPLKEGSKYGFYDYHGYTKFGLIPPGAKRQ